MNALRESIDRRLDALEAKWDARFDKLDARVDRVNAQLERKLPALCTRRFSLVLTVISTTATVGAIFLAEHFYGAG